jgi:2-methylcitrate dehydratase PrpD
LRASAGVFQPRVLRVTTRTGDRLEARVEVNRGGPGNPLSDEELATKFHLNATRTLPEAHATRTLTLPEATSLTPLTTLLPPGDGR